MSEPAGTAEGLVVRPEPAAWGRALSREGWALDDRSRRFREQLGLATDRPIVMTGHQAQVWHPGILAKYVATDAAARRSGAASAWVVADQDTNDPFTLRVPVWTPSAGAAPARLRVVDVGAGLASVPEGVPAGRVAARRPGPGLPPGVSPASASVIAGVEAVRGALARFAGEGSAARQVSRAVAELFAPYVAAAPAVFATDVPRTDLFGEVLGRMVSEPGAMARAYNAAAARHPNAGVAPLEVGDGDGGVELPVWRIGKAMGSRRERVTARALREGAHPRDEIVPRALLMTGLMRLAGCELFVHGTGGGGAEGSGGYDAVTAEWLGGWLGESIEPMAVVTATLRLRLGGARVGPEEIARTRWRAHAARHHPALLGDAATEGAKAALVERVRRTSKRLRAERAAAYREMHGLLERSRAAHAARLAELDAAAREAAGARAEAEIVSDRTWAFPLYEPEQLGGLKRAIEGAFGV